LIFGRKIRSLAALLKVNGRQIPSAKKEIENVKE